MLTFDHRQHQLFVCLMAGALALLVASSARADGFAYNTPCDACPDLESKFHKPGCFRLRCLDGCFKDGCLGEFVDAVSDGFQRLLLCDCGCGSLGRCGDSRSLCDDGCDAAMMDELMVPAPIRHDRPAFAQPLAPRAAPPVIRRPQPNSGWQAAQPPTQNRIPSQGRVSDEGQPLAPTRIPAPLPDPPESDSTPQRESLFDSLSDPFLDDQSRKQTDRSVRRTSHQEIGLWPVVRRLPLPLSQAPSSYQTRSSSQTRSSYQTRSSSQTRSIRSVNSVR